jgi:predicted RNase H-related nuclease YkuK (DUF458 family)
VKEFDMGKKIDIEEIRSFLANCGPATKVYIGTDSERFKNQGVWFADYITAVVIHMANDAGGFRGGKIFGEVHRERDMDQRVDRPFNRMMKEAMRSAEIYLLLKEVLYDFEVEVHLDISADEINGSNVAAQAAVGYIKAMCNVTPILKSKDGFGGGPSFAASFAADRLKEFQPQIAVGS